MTSETQKRLRPLYDQVVEHFCRVNGSKNYEEAVSALRENVFRNKETSPAAWIHQIARQAYSTNEPDTIPIENFYEVLGLIDTREKSDFVFASLPEDSAPQIERFLRFILKDFLPSQKAAAQELAKRLPQRRSGGADPKLPNPEERRKIWNWISELNRKGVTWGDAQRRAAAKFALKLRMIQTICTLERPK
jgi:hypothetical protein